MKITFFGAAGEVTGSAYRVVTPHARILVDGGMFQGGTRQEAKNQPSSLRNLGRLDTVLVTHAHLDHTGRLPLLVKAGYSGPFYATAATREMTEIVLQDSARIQESDARRDNRKNERAGRPLVEPLYTPDDVDKTLNLFRSVEYDTPHEVAPGVTARWTEAGHLLGSASIQLIVEEGAATKKFVFSGDIGPADKPLIRDVDPTDYAHVVVMESTYGGRDHESLVDSNDEALSVIRRTVERNGKVLVPSFALGRTQELLYGLAAAFDSGVLPRFPVYVDSPMAIKATDVYRRHPELFDDEAVALVESGVLRREMSHVTPTASAAESIALNDTSGPMMIIAGSGMCTGGRILHHLRHNLWRPEASVIFVGYQAEGSLGREITEGAERVRIFGDTIQVNAQVATINGFSGHAGQSELVQWYDHMAASKPKLILTHGEDGSRRALASLLKERHGVEASLPNYRETIEV